MIILSFLFGIIALKVLGNYLSLCAFFIRLVFRIICGALVLLAIVLLAVFGFR